jgi:GDP-mannose pyrophosphatase NudK
MKTHKGGGLQQEQEEIEVLELPYDQTLDMIDQGHIKDAKTIMLLQYLKIKNLI